MRQHVWELDLGWLSSKTMHIHSTRTHSHLHNALDKSKAHLHANPAHSTAAKFRKSEILCLPDSIQASARLPRSIGSKHSQYNMRAKRMMSVMSTLFGMPQLLMHAYMLVGTPLRPQVEAASRCLQSS